MNSLTPARRDEALRKMYFAATYLEIEEEKKSAPSTEILSLCYQVKNITFKEVNS